MVKLFGGSKMDEETLNYIDCIRVMAAIQKGHRVRDIVNEYPSGYGLDEKKAHRIFEDLDKKKIIRLSKRENVGGNELVVTEVDKNWKSVASYIDIIINSTLNTFEENSRAKGATPGMVLVSFIDSMSAYFTGVVIKDLKNIGEKSITEAELVLNAFFDSYSGHYLDVIKKLKVDEREKSDVYKRGLASLEKLGIIEYDEKLEILRMNTRRTNELLTKELILTPTYVEKILRSKNEKP